jgi:hypothetical protein
MELEGAQPTPIRNFSGFIQDIDTFWPPGIDRVGSIGHGIHAERNWEMESFDEIVGDGHALLKRLRLRVAHTLVEIGGHLPLVQRMGFADVDREKLGAVFVILIELSEVAYLAAKRRSGVASKNQDKRAPADAIPNRKSRLAIESDQFDVGSRIANAQIAAVPVRQRVP